MSPSSVVRKSRRGWNDKDDMMVPVVGSRLWAAATFLELAPADLARRSEESPQTVHLIITGVTKKCRLGRLKRLAKALRRPELLSWLQGEVDGLPYVTWAHDADSLTEPYDAPPLYQFAQYYFITECLRAFKRDLKKYLGNDNQNLQATFRDHEWQVAGNFGKLVDVENARRTYQGSTDGWPALSRDELDAATVAKARLEETLLAPWLRGRGYLDYDKLTGVKDFLETITR